MGNRLYVGNLSFNTTTEELRAEFAKVGNVVDTRVMTDRETGRSRGFAFVTMATDAEAATAIRTMNGVLFGGRPLRVNEAEERGSRPGGGGGGGGGGGYRTNNANSTPRPQDQQNPNNSGRGRGRGRDNRGRRYGDDDIEY